jgi:hypothetical protein
VWETLKLVDHETSCIGNIIPLSFHRYEERPYRMLYASCVSIWRQVVLDSMLDSKIDSTILNWIGSPPWSAHLRDSLAPSWCSIGHMSYPILQAKPSTRHMHDPGSIVPHIRPKLFTDYQISWIKYNYYINNVSKDYDNSQAKRNSGRLHNSTWMETGATHSLELIIEEFQSIFSFWAASLSSRGKIARLSTLMVGTQ